MPVIIVEIGDQMTLDKKKELVQRLTKTAAEVTEISEQAFTIYIHENEHNNIGVGGKLLTEVLAERD